MSEYSEAAEQTIKFSFEGMDYALRITGSVSKELISALYTIMNNKQQTKGKTTLTNMMKSGRPVQIFQVQKEHLKDFAREAKKYGVVYVVVNDKRNLNGNVDIIVREEDKAKIDRIISKFEHDAPSKEEEEKLRARSMKSLDEKKKVEADKEYLENNSPSKTTNEKVETDVEDLLQDDILQEDKEVKQVNPSQALTGHQFENTLNRRLDNKEKRKSVRAELQKYSMEIEQNQKQQTYQRQNNYKRNYNYKSQNKKYHNRNKKESR